MEATLTALLPYATAFGLALLHSLWIGVLIYCLVRALQPLMPGPAGRHHLAYGGLLLLGVGFGVSYYLSFEANPVCEAVALNTLAFNGSGPVELSLSPAPEMTWSEWFRYQLPAFAPWLSVAYWLGLLPATVFLLRDQERVWELRRNGLSALPAAWAERLGEDLARHPATRRVRCFLSERAGEVMTLGFWSPVIVFPVALVNELSPEMARTILLHELAHLRHYDHWLNYPQQLLKTFFFYHPAAYALCHLIDREREHRCDDFVAARCSDRRTYATALVTVARTSHIPPNNLVMSATKTHFSTRIQRMFLGEHRRKDGRFAFSVLLFALLGAAHFAFTGADAGAGDCSGEEPVVAEFTPAPVIVTPLSCSEPARLLSAWDNEAPQPPASDNVRAWAAYERAVARYERVHEKVAAAAHEVERKLRTPCPQTAKRDVVVRPLPTPVPTKVKAPCPQASLSGKLRAVALRDSVPPAPERVVIRSEQRDKVAYFVNGKRIQAGTIRQVAPRNIEHIKVVKNTSELQARNLADYDGAVFISLNGEVEDAIAAAAAPAKTVEIPTLDFEETQNSVFLVDGRRVSLTKVRKIAVNDVERIDVFKGSAQAKKHGYPRKAGVVKIYTKF